MDAAMASLASFAGVPRVAFLDFTQDKLLVLLELVPARQDLALQGFYLFHQGRYLRIELTMMRE